MIFFTVSIVCLHKIIGDQEHSHEYSFTTDDQDEQDESLSRSGELSCSVFHTFIKGSNNLCHKQEICRWFDSYCIVNKFTHEELLKGFGLRHAAYSDRMII
jgi:hypothetical protein